MGMNPTRNPFKRARLGLDAQQAVDEYKARSVWAAWWALDESVRRRYFTKDERAFITRYGSRLDELATHREVPSNEKEQHFVRVCMGDAEPSKPRERMWLLVQIVCRFEAAATRSARADLAEHDAFALRAENTKLKARTDHVVAGAILRSEKLTLLVTSGEHIVGARPMGTFFDPNIKTSTIVAEQGKTYAFRVGYDQNGTTTFDRSMPDVL